MDQAFDYHDTVVHSDINRADHVRKKPERVKRLMRSYARNQGAQTPNTVLVQDIYVKSLNVAEAFKVDEALLRSYNLVSSATDEVIGINGDSNSDGASAITWTFKGNSMNQIWTPVRRSDGSYYLKNYQTGLVLAVKDGALVQTALSENDASQNWTATLMEDGTVTLRNGETGTYLTAADGSHSLTLSKTNDAAAQRWQFRTVAHVDRRVLFQIDTEVFDILRHPAPAERARRMQMLKRFACLLLASHKFCDHFVHFPRTEASPARDDERTLVKPQLLARRLPAGV